MDAENLEILISQNKPINEIGKILGKSPQNSFLLDQKTWTKTKFKSFKDSGKPPTTEPLIKTCRKCKVELNTSNSAWGRGHICRQCKSEVDVKRRKSRKSKAIEYKGGKCNVCGYDKTPSALEFHHINPFSKEKEPHLLNSMSWDKQKEELDKCILLCANCHREVHDRLRVDDKFNVLDWVSDPDSRYN